MQKFQGDKVTKTASTPALIILLRPHQWIKNLFVFAPMLFSFSFSLDNLTATIVAFALFSAVASSIYILNDLMDKSEDRTHPTKRNRPIASGAVSARSAKYLFVFLSFIALGTAITYSLELFAVLFAYFVLNIFYSLKLKHITLVDISIISAGFVLRLFAGSTVISVSLSMWIVIVTFLLALFLALAKRRDDVILSHQGKQTRKNIDGYNLEFVNASMVLMASVISVSYILYTVSSEVAARLHTHYLYLTSFFVIIGILRYMQITFVELNSGSPTKLVLGDRFLQVTIVLWLVCFFVIVKF
jgi:decaprenyl-phosphate phosphoribosyltransferase